MVGSGGAERALEAEGTVCGHTHTHSNTQVKPVLLRRKAGDEV